MQEWREALAKDIFKNNHSLFDSGDHEKDAGYLKEITQRMLDRIIFMRFCEDRQFVHREPLKNFFEERTDNVGKNTMVFLREEFKHYNIIFDSDLFRPQEWDNSLIVDFKVMHDIILESYNPYQFDVIPIEVLGNIYEQYLGYTIRLTDHQVKYELKPDVRKAGGVYYTPEYIVDYIVKSTVGKLLQELPATKIKKLRILDPACGSGSFLIRTYEEMLNWYKNQKKGSGAIHRTKQVHTQQLLRHEEAEPILTIEEKAKILQEHIFGVDIDEQAVEVTKLSLMLKMLEGEFGIIPGRNILPMLDKNIKCGNSLISDDTLELKKYFGDDYYKVKAFNWNEEFKQIVVHEGGFDVVIGNPPYISFYSRESFLDYYKDELNWLITNYAFTQKYLDRRLNTVMFFLERSLNLLKLRGCAGFIIDANFLEKPFRAIRKFIDDTHVEIKISKKISVFEKVSSDQIIIIINKTKNNEPVKIIKFDPNKIQFNTLKETIQRIEFRRDILNLNIDRLVLSTKRKLSDIADISTGVQIGIGGPRIYKGQKISDLFYCEKQMPGFYENISLSPKDFFRYSPSKVLNYINLSEHLAYEINKFVEKCNIAVTKAEDFKDSDKIFIRQSSPKIVATSGYKGQVCEYSAFMLKTKNPSELKYVLALLNSKLLTFYALKENIILTGGKKQPQIRIKGLQLLSIPEAPAKKLHDDLVALVDVMLDLSKKLQTAKGAEKNQIQRQIEKTDMEIDDLVCNLYGITEEERKTIEAASN